jgi:transcriptional regulator with XRE-family HTH domain
VNEQKIVRAVIERLIRERESEGVSQKQLSAMTGLSRSGIRHMEDGDVSPTLVFLLKICRALDVEFADIFRDAKDTTAP